MNAPSVAATREGRLGLALGVVAFGFWGLFPLYFKALDTVPPLELLGHRVVWSVPLLALLVHYRRLWPQVGAAARDRRALRVLLLTTILIAVNWLLFIWAVVNDQVLQASLGYFVNPLVSVFLGVALLGERLTRAGVASVTLAGLGVAYMTVVGGELPVVALVLAFSFGLYGLLRKTAAVGAGAGLLVETVLLAPAALGYLVWASWHGTLRFGSGGAAQTLLLSMAGVVTILPLLCFTGAARRLPLSTVGLLQYLAPTGNFLLAVLVFGEPFDRHRLAAFGCIWAALALFTAEQVLRARRVRARVVSGPAVRDREVGGGATRE